MELGLLMATLRLNEHDKQNEDDESTKCKDSIGKSSISFVFLLFLKCDNFDVDILKL